MAKGNKIIEYGGEEWSDDGDESQTESFMLSFTNDLGVTGTVDNDVCTLAKRLKNTTLAGGKSVEKSTTS